MTCFSCRTPAGARTLDTLIKSQVLYQLSYGCEKEKFEKLFCTPAGARTLDTLIKSQVLYQLSYGCILFFFAGAKVCIFSQSAKFLLVFFTLKSVFCTLTAKTEAIDRFFPAVRRVFHLLSRPPLLHR